MSGTEPGAPPFRYDARLASEIEARWQRRWEADGTFHSPSPAGPLSEGFGRVKGLPRFYVLSPDACYPGNTPGSI